MTPSLAAGVRTPVALRVVILLAGGGLVVLPHHLLLVPAAVTTVGVLLATAVPGLLGEVVLFGGLLLAWVAGSGWHTVPSIWRTVLAALLVYVVQATTTLAAFVPLGAAVETEALTRWLRGLLWPAVAAVPLVALDLALPRSAGSPVLELAGVAALALIAVVVLVRVRSTAR